VIGARIVEPFSIRDENPEYRAELKKLMPIAIVAGETRSIEADADEPGSVTTAAHTHRPIWRDASL
jgi:hypothetical protein